MLKLVRKLIEIHLARNEKACGYQATLLDARTQRVDASRPTILLGDAGMVACVIN